MIPGQGTSGSPEDLLEMQIPTPRPRLWDAGGGAQQPVILVLTEGGQPRSLPFPVLFPGTVTPPRPSLPCVLPPGPQACSFLSVPTEYKPWALCSCTDSSLTNPEPPSLSFPLYGMDLVILSINCKVLQNLGRQCRDTYFN